MRDSFDAAGLGFSAQVGGAPGGGAWAAGTPSAAAFAPDGGRDQDAVEAYFECITACSLDDGECVTTCTAILRE